MKEFHGLGETPELTVTLLDTVRNSWLASTVFAILLLCGIAYVKKPFRFKWKFVFTILAIALLAPPLYLGAMKLFR